MGFFSRKKAQPAPAPAAEVPVAQPSSPHAAYFQNVQAPQQSPAPYSQREEFVEQVEEAEQYRVPPIPLHAQLDDYYRPVSSQRCRSASPQRGRAYYPDSYRDDYSVAPSEDMNARNGSVRSDGLHVRMGPDGHVSIRADRGKKVSLRKDSLDSDDACCYRSSSFCRTCRKNDYCDCYPREQSCRHRHHDRGHHKVEVREQTFACYDPNCRGGEACRQWSFQREQAPSGSGTHQQPHATTTTTTTYHTTPAGQIFVSGVQPLGLQPTIQPLGLQPSIQPLGLQPPMNPQSYVIAGTTPVTTSVMQTTAPYLVSNRPFPVTYGGVPVVVPQATGFQTQYIGAVGGGAPQMRKLC